MKSPAPPKGKVHMTDLERALALAQSQMDLIKQLNDRIKELEELVRANSQPSLPTLPEYPRIYRDPLFPQWEIPPIWHRPVITCEVKP
jgi:hypothetical protein